MTAHRRQAFPRLALSGAALFLWLVTGPAAAADAKAPGTVADGKLVSIEYTLTLPDKTEIDSNVGTDPLTYTQGGEEILPSLQKKLTGLKVGESKTVTLSPENAYGAVDPKAHEEVKKDLVPEGSRKVGALLWAKDPAGHSRYLRVAEVKEDTIVLDFNHPLAGKTLVFDVKVTKIEDAPPSTKKEVAPAGTAAKP